ncbi:MAG TPA: thymidylate kinase, partial [Beijerinckiaceae bacterium]|nr:thymidylate kinase [Beijerinckiaceae bacterium]
QAADRFEQQDLDFHRTVRAAFLAIAAGEPQRCTVIDASQPAEAVFAAVVAAVTSRLAAVPC